MNQIKQTNRLRNGCNWEVLLGVCKDQMRYLHLALGVLDDIAHSNNFMFVCLFDLILYVHSTIFQLCGTVLPGFNQY